MFIDSFWYRLWNYTFGAIVIATAIIWMVLLSTAVTKQPAARPSETRNEVKQEASRLAVEEITRMSNENKLRSKNLTQQIFLLEKEIGVTCTLATPQYECASTMAILARDEDVLSALKEIRKNGVEIEVSWYKPTDSNIYVNDLGTLRIHESTTPEELRRVLVNK